MASSESGGEGGGEHGGAPNGLRSQDADGRTCEWDAARALRARVRARSSCSATHEVFDLGERTRAREPHP